MSILNEIVKELKQSAKQIRYLESEANAALYDQENRDQYHRLMVEKALILQNLPESLGVQMKSLDPKLALSLKNQIGAFSFSAAKALDLDSVFYMSALLYPEDYAEGDNNDLENFILQLESSC